MAEGIGADISEALHGDGAFERSNRGVATTTEAVRIDGAGNHNLALTFEQDASPTDIRICEDDAGYLNRTAVDLYAPVLSDSLSEPRNLAGHRDSVSVKQNAATAGEGKTLYECAVLDRDSASEDRHVHTALAARRNLASHGDGVAAVEENAAAAEEAGGMNDCVAPDDDSVSVHRDVSLARKHDAVDHHRAIAFERERSAAAENSEYGVRCDCDRRRGTGDLTGASRIRGLACEAFHSVGKAASRG
ncbi:MAG: hypothetical protein ACREI8_04175 [Myxococcota bacterium]